MESSSWGGWGVDVCLHMMNIFEEGCNMLLIFTGSTELRPSA